MFYAVLSAGVLTAHTAPYKRVRPPVGLRDCAFYNANGAQISQQTGECQCT